MYFLTIVAIFKNESHIIREWIEHYLQEGVDHFYLIDNDSTDKYQEMVAPYISEGLVEISRDARVHMQEEHYNNYYLDKVKQNSTWVMVVDLDEFIYSRKPFATISSYLKSLNNGISQVYVPWKVYGSSGQLEQPSSCLETFTKRTIYNHTKTNCMSDNDKILCKYLVNTHFLTRLSIHVATVSGGQEITSDGKSINTVNKTFQFVSEDSLRLSVLHCNHYPIQSFDWFRRIKMTRGSANHARNDKVRTTDYFNSFDSHANQKLDDELAQKRLVLRGYYGAEIYKDVTRHLYKHFMSGQQLVIGADVVLNHFFGDPKPGMEKYLTIRYKGRLYVYPENNHGEILIKL
jgi:hypothetical protein